jgi:hypothetical protein
MNLRGRSSRDWPHDLLSTIGKVQDFLNGEYAFKVNFFFVLIYELKYDITMIYIVNALVSGVLKFTLYLFELIFSI